MERRQVPVLHFLESCAQPLIVPAHVLCNHGCPVDVILVGHGHMVHCGPCDGPHLSGIDLRKAVRGGGARGGTSGHKSGSSRGGVLVASPGPRRPVPHIAKLESEGHHSGVPGLPCLFQPMAKAVRPCHQMGVRRGGQVLPDCSPDAAGMGASMHGVQGSPFLVMVQRFFPRGEVLYLWRGSAPATGAFLAGEGGRALAGACWRCLW